MILLAPLCDDTKHVDLVLAGLSPQEQACHYGWCQPADDHAGDCATHDAATVLRARLHWKLKRQRELAKRGSTCSTS